VFSSLGARSGLYRFSAAPNAVTQLDRACPCPSNQEGRTIAGGTPSGSLEERRDVVEAAIHDPGTHRAPRRQTLGSKEQKEQRIGTVA